MERPSPLDAPTTTVRTAGASPLRVTQMLDNVPCDLLSWPPIERIASPDVSDHGDWPLVRPVRRRDRRRPVSGVPTPSRDPYDVEIDADPYPVFRRLREEAPLYRNDTYDFYALSRFADVEAGLVDRETYISSRGAILELIKANIEMPSGVVIFEDPPIHTVHRGLLSRVFTPKKMNALEPEIRDFCARSLDPLVGTGSFDFVRDLGAQMPMRVIGMLMGIPEQDQESIREQSDAQLRTEAGQPMQVSQDRFVTGEAFAEYIDWRAEHPSDDLMTELLQRRVRGRDRHDATPDARGGAHVRQRGGGCRQRDDDQA